MQILINNGFQAGNVHVPVTGGCFISQQHRVINICVISLLYKTIGARKPKWLIHIKRKFTWKETGHKRQTFHGIHYVQTRTIYMKSFEINSVSYHVQIRSIRYLS